MEMEPVDKRGVGGMQLMCQKKSSLVPVFLLRSSFKPRIKPLLCVACESGQIEIMENAPRVKCVGRDEGRDLNFMNAFTKGKEMEGRRIQCKRPLT